MTLKMHPLIGHDSSSHTNKDIIDKQSVIHISFKVRENIGYDGFYETCGYVSLATQFEKEYFRESFNEMEYINP